MSQPVATPEKAVSHSTTTDGARRTPGESGIWIFILLDMTLFAMMFGSYAWYRASSRDLFASSQHLVNPVYGLVYTLLLLTSSWCVVMAVTAARKRQLDLASRFIPYAFELGAAFVAIKFVEYGAKYHQGITPVTNDFFMFYFMMTLVHLLHASVGLGVLVYMRKQVGALDDSIPRPDQDPMRMIVVGGIYWHMVDLLWVFLFALFYLRS